MASFEPSGIEDGAKVEYLADQVLVSPGPIMVIDPITHLPIFLPPLNLPNIGGNATWTTDKPELREGTNGFTVRQTDVAGNVKEQHVSFTLDTHGPNATPTLALDADSGSSATDKVTNSPKITIGNLEPLPGDAWDARVDGGDWFRGGSNDGTGQALLDLHDYQDGNHTVIVRQHDAAGNTGPESEALTFTLDRTAPDVAVTFDRVSGSLEGTPNVTTASKVDVGFSYQGQLAETDVVEWRKNGGEWTSLGVSRDAEAHTFTIYEMSTQGSDPLVEVRVGDAAGNFTTIVEQSIDGPYTVPVVTPPVETAPVSTFAVQQGLDLPALDSKVYLHTNEQFVYLQPAEGGVDPIAGMTGIQAQAVAVSGQLHIGESLTPADGITYTLGTDSNGESLGGSYVWGFGGNDTITGTAGDDHLFGGDGNDVFHATKGSDIISGGSGQDVFRFDGGLSVLKVASDGAISGVDTITDFNAQTDKLVFEGLDVAILPTGGMTVSSTFYTSIAALVEDAQLVMSINGDVVFAGQLGADTYVLAKDASSVYTAGVDSMVKLANFSAAGLMASNVGGVSVVHANGAGNVFYTMNAQDDVEDMVGMAHVYVHGRDIDEIGFQDTLMGGDGDDVIVGGKGADRIYLTSGHDTLVYTSPEDSNLAAFADMTAGMTFDSVMIGPDVQKVTLNFGGGVLGVHAVVAPSDLFSGGDMLGGLDALYHSVATSRYDAVLVYMEGTSILMVNNGDDQIDGNDYGVGIMSTGTIALDESGNVVFTTATTPVIGQPPAGP